MTMPYSPSRATFQGNGVATTFPFSFKVWSTDQLTVTVTTPDATYTEEDVTAQCAITLTESGGTVTYTRNGAPLARRGRALHHPQHALCAGGGPGFRLPFRPAGH